MTDRMPRPDPFVRHLLLAAAVVVGLAALYAVRRALVFVYFAGLLAVALSPAVRLLERWALRPFGRRRAPRTLALLVLFLGVLGVVAGMVTVVAQPLVSQADQLWQDLPKLANRARDLLVAHGLLLPRTSVQDVVLQTPKDLVLGTLRTTGVGVVGGLFGGAALLVLTFYLLVESGTLFEQALQLVPSTRRPALRDAARSITSKVSAWLGGTLLLSAVVGTATAVVLGFAGVPYFYVLAVLAFIGEFFPYFGPFLAAIPGVLIGLADSWVSALWIGLFFLVLQQLENHLLVPQIFESRVGLSAVTVLVAILIGGELLGILGIILAVPSAAIVQVIFEELRQGEESP